MLRILSAGGEVGSNFAITAKLGGNDSSAAQNLYKRRWEGYFKIISYSPSKPPVSLPHPSPEPLPFQLPPP